MILEPALWETTATTCVTIIREAMEEAARRGVPKDAARAFILGHRRIELAVVFGEADRPFADGAIKATNRAQPQLFRGDWQRVFDWDRVDGSVSEILGTEIKRA